MNLHKSGLKVSSKVVPEKVEKVFNRAADAVAEATGKVEDKVRRDCRQVFPAVGTGGVAWSHVVVVAKARS